MIFPVMSLAISEWQPDDDSSTGLDMLAAVLHAAVHAGASVSFILPFSREDARAFWERDVMPRVLAGTRRVLVARLAARVVGTVQLDFATPPNQRHRAEILKLLVHPDARRQGVGRALMIAAEALARADNRTLLTLDTRTGDLAEPLYLSLGFVRVGVIPNYARAPHSPVLEATTIMYKQLAP
ncbi:MAG TPA: GNAT family N-acetyltransferase [Candidatus Acidoferrales bacterium]|nr:GNAT family N-acetyltransferase [Candidatus Acidoferrales bacterium]